MVGVTTPTTSAWLKHSDYLKLKGCGHERGNSLLEPKGTRGTNQHFFEATSTGSFHGVHIPSVTYRWSCSKTGKSNCCSHETRFTEATYAFRRRDAVNCALNSEVGTTPPCGCKPFGSYSHSYFCSFVTSLVTNFVHSSRFSGQFFQLCPFITILLTPLSMRHALLDEFSILSIHRDVLNVFFRTNEIDALTKHLPTAFITTCHHQRQGPNCTFSCGATEVLAQDTWFVHRSDCPALTFWKLEFSLHETGVAPTSLQQPNVGLCPIRARGQSRLLRLRPIRLPHGHKQKSFKIDCSPMPSVAALTTAANSDFPDRSTL